LLCKFEADLYFLLRLDAKFGGSLCSV
jgi:hypothetical protein